MTTPPDLVQASVSVSRPSLNIANTEVQTATYSHSLWLLGAFGLMLILARLLAFPLLPVDETRYMSVAWEMAQSGNWLVPHLNGQPYAQKPPMMFWLINILWQLGIDNSMMARLVMPFMGLLNIFALRALVLCLVPAGSDLAKRAPWFLLTLMPWVVYAPLNMFDMTMSLFVLLASVALFKAQRHHRWLLASGVAVGLGMLTKGPVFFLYWLPLVLLAKYWRPESLMLKRWYSGVLLASIIGIGVILAWAIPAAIHGGPAYADAIFWKQSAGRVDDAFAHSHPWYWYLPLLPLLWMPWILTPFWKGGLANNPWQRFALCGVLPQLLLFSLVSAKQVHYLIPTLPYAALWFASKWPVLKTKTAFLLFPLLVITVFLAVIPEITRHYFPAEQLPVWTRALAVIPMLLAVWVWRKPLAVVVAFPIALQLALCLAGVMIHHYYDLRPFAKAVTALQQQGVAVAYIGHYADEFRYLGRGNQNLDVVSDNDASAVTQWANTHPAGQMVTIIKKPDAKLRAEATLVAPYRSRYLVMVPSRYWQPLYLEMKQ
ncbi:ArnT family glycosyltransferase [Gallaecimonas mangrovi]|uniref:ArnT family glycosyltransferase n=1 Tax=Gallaecimonas mangrovi TaxID=2291597 RepID=UPI000E20302C|nr:glycosyltransferase family 39 protein [Gallaecimonas mangrovi]